MFQFSTLKNSVQVNFGETYSCVWLFCWLVAAIQKLGLEEKVYIMAGGNENIELKFRIYDGTDIGHSRYASSTTVAALKQKLVSEWPQGLRLSFHPDIYLSSRFFILFDCQIFQWFYTILSLITIKKCIMCWKTWWCGLW